MINDHLLKRIQFERKRIRQLGIPTVTFRLLKKVFSVIIWVLLLPLSIILHLIGYRHVSVFSRRIGHLALEPDCLLKDQALGNLQERRWFMLAPYGQVSNEHLLEYWEGYIRVFRNKFICYCLESMSRWLILHHDIEHYTLSFDHAHEVYKVYAQWGDRPPLLKINDSDKNYLIESLMEMGIPKDKWYICVHNREEGFSPVDDELHTHRNASVEPLIPAIKEIVGLGGWVIRMGDPSMTPLPELDNVVDYAHHPLKSSKLDILLCANAKFMLGSTSGISFVSAVFGVPCALVNMIPISTLALRPNDLSIPKLLWSKELGRHLNMHEIMNTPVANYRYSSLYCEAGLRIDDNSSEDIIDLVHEMFDQLDGKSSIGAEDEELQVEYMNQFTPNHLSYYAGSKIGIKFLRKNRFLLN